MVERDVMHPKLRVLLPAPDRAWLWLGAIVLLALALRLSLFFPLARHDSYDYGISAAKLFRGEPVFDANANPIHDTRLSMLLPISLLFRLFGVSETVMAFWPLACSVGAVVVVYLIGRELGGVRAGLLAALVLALHSLEIAYATQVLPDAVVPFFTALTVLGYLRGWAECDRPCRRLRWFFLSGVALGCAYYARLNAPVLGLVLAADLLWRRRFTRSLLGIPAGFVAVLVVAGGVFALGGGGFTFDLRTSIAPYFAAENRSLFTAPATFEHYTVYTRMLLADPLFRTWTWLGVASSALLLARRRGALVFPGLWLLGLFLYLEVLSQWPVVSLPEKGDRMATILSAPMAVLIGLALAELTGRRGRRTLVASSVVAVVLAGALVPGLTAVRAARAQLDALAQEPTRSYPKATAAVLRALPPGPVWVSTNWTQRLRFHLGFPASGAPTTWAEQVPVERLDFGPAGVPAVSVAGYVVHDRAIALNRPGNWKTVAEVNPRVVVFETPGTRPAPRDYHMQLEAEAFRDVELDQDYALDRLKGWASYSQSMYSAGKAAIVKQPGVTMRARLWQLPPGDYRVSLRVYDYGSGTNKVRLTLNGVDADYQWSGPSAGVRTLVATLPGTQGGDDLTVTAAQIGQTYLVVDRIGVSPAGAPWREPLRLEGEAFRGIEPAPGDDYSRAEGWTSYEVSFYSGGRAAITKRTGGALQGELLAVPPGDYRVELTVYDYGSGENELAVTLNGQTLPVTWSGGPAGVRRVVIEFRGNPGGGALRLVPTRIGQSYLIVDSVTVTGAE
ncbi:MAG: glycosyltransferase family 39 protein [Chloroflexi bacterium]|nr:glycosyltransferase family 39 protein [Chloroflexota bacterium]